MNRCLGYHVINSDGYPPGPALQACKHFLSRGTSKLPGNFSIYRSQQAVIIACEPDELLITGSAHLVSMTASYPCEKISRSCVAFVVLVIVLCTVPVAAQSTIPVAGFNADPWQGNAYDPVRFTDTSEGNPVSWHWDFGDGETSSLRSPVHTYTYLGVYEVSLTITDAAGRSATVKKEVYMADSGTPVPSTIVRERPPEEPRETPESPAGVISVLAGLLVLCMIRK